MHTNKYDSHLTNNRWKTFPLPLVIETIKYVACNGFYNMNHELWTNKYKNKSHYNNDSKKTYICEPL